MRPVEAPIDCAACTYMFSRTETTAERMMREPAMPSSKAEREDDLRQARAEHGHHDEQDDEVRKTHPGIDEALHDQVELAAEIAGDRMPITIETTVASVAAVNAMMTEICAP